MTIPIVQTMPVIVSSVFSPPVIRSIKKDIVLLIAGLILFALSLFLICFLMPLGVPVSVIATFAIMPGVIIVVMASSSINQRKRALQFSREYTRLQNENIKLKLDNRKESNRCRSLDNQIKELVAQSLENNQKGSMWDGYKYLLFQNERLHKELSHCRRHLDSLERSIE